MEFSARHPGLEGGASAGHDRQYNGLKTRGSLYTVVAAIKMTEIFTQAGLPAGVLNLVLGAGEDVGDEIVQHPDVHAISFTGSNEIGGSDLR